MEIQEILKIKFNKFIFGNNNIKIYGCILNSLLLDDILKLKKYVKEKYNIIFYKYENTYNINNDY